VAWRTSALAHQDKIRRCIRVKFALFRCKSAKLFFCCCDSVAAPRHRPGQHDEVTVKNQKRRGRHRPRHHDQVPATHGATIKYLQCTTSGAAGDGLGTTAKFLRAAAGNGLGTTLNYLRGAASIGLGTTAIYMQLAASSTAGSGLGRTIN